MAAEEFRLVDLAGHRRPSHAVPPEKLDRPAELRDADALFRNGSVSYLEVLNAQRGLYGSQQSEITLDLAEQDNRIALYKALGGGWKESN